jgi:hypothetical protein
MGNAPNEAIGKMGNAPNEANAPRRTKPLVKMGNAPNEASSRGRSGDWGRGRPKGLPDPFHRNQEILFDEDAFVG